MVSPPVPMDARPVEAVGRLRLLRGVAQRDQGHRDAPRRAGRAALAAAPRVPRAGRRPPRPRRGPGRARPTADSRWPLRNPAPSSPGAAPGCCRRRPRSQPGASFSMLAYGWNTGIASSRARSSMTTKCHGCWLPADGAAIAARSTLSISSGGTARGVNRRTLRRVRIACKASIDTLPKSKIYLIPARSGGLRRAPPGSVKDRPEQTRDKLKNKNQDKSGKSAS